MKFFGYLLFFQLIAWQVGAQNVLIASFPFEMHNDHIVIPVKINGHGPLNFVFDTGAGGTMVDSLTAHMLGFDEGIERTNTGAAGTHKVQVHRFNTVEVGAAAVKNVTIMSSNTEFEFIDSNRKIHGIIGFHILSKFVIEVDYIRKFLSIYNHSNFEYLGLGSKYEFTLAFNMPMIVLPLRVDDSPFIDANFLIDTGARADLLLNSPFVNDFNVISKVGAVHSVNSVIGSSQTKAKVYFGRVKALKLGSEQFSNVPAVLSQADQGVLSFDEIHGLIGNRILKRFNTVYNYNRGIVYFEPNANAKSKFSVNSIGFTIRFNRDRLFIKDIITGGPAEKAGLISGAEITKINSRQIHHYSKNEIRELMLRDGTAIHLSYIQNGESASIKLRLKAVM